MISASEEKLPHRQVHPSWVHDGEPSSQTFRPTGKDQHKLSVYDGKQISAEGSHAHYTGLLKLLSAGVLSVSCGEVESAGLAWKVDGIPFPAHGHVDFGNLNAHQQKAKASVLKAKAWSRGWTYQT